MNLLHQRWASYDPQAKFIFWSVFLRFYWNTIILIHLHAAVAELNSFHRNCDYLSSPLLEKFANTSSTYLQTNFSIINVFSIYLKHGARRLTESILTSLDSIVFPPDFSCEEINLNGQHCFKPQWSFKEKKKKDQVHTR